jgi:hypothetical protein
MLSWDFSSYVLNSKYLFYGGNYFEPFRPPMVPFLLGFFLIFGVFGEFLYIIFVSCLFLYSSIKLADVLFSKYRMKFETKYARFLFYFFSLTPFAIDFSFKGGSELLSLALFEIFLFLLLSKKISGHFLAFTILARYNFLIFFPLLFFNKSYKKILLNLLSFFAILFPWLLFNYIKLGNWFASFVDLYAFNLIYRRYGFIPFHFSEIFLVIDWVFLFFIIGAVFAAYDFFTKREKWISYNKEYLLLVLIFIITIKVYIAIPIKDLRYLFNLILPISFFSTLGFAFIISKLKKYKKIFFVMIFFIFVINFLILADYFHDVRTRDDMYYSAGEDIKRLGIENCEIMSSRWIFVSYYTGNSYPIKNNTISDSLEKNKIILVFKDIEAMDENEEIKYWPTYSKLYETSDYVFLAKKGVSGKNCAKAYVYDTPYINNYCEIISMRFKKIGLQEKSLHLCNYINNIPVK